MSPFALWLRNARKNRGIRQVSLAHSMGYEQGYLSGIELGLRPPSKEFLARFAAHLQLSEEELYEMEQALQCSKRRLVLPVTAMPEAFELLNDLSKTLNRLSPEQIQFVRQALTLSSGVRASTEREVDMAQR